jgi:hypothetical protein
MYGQCQRRAKMMYQLVFRGECASGTDVQTARSNAMALFKASLDQVDRMFSGQRVVIRNKLEEAQAKKYQAVMHKHGMVAHLEGMEVEPAPASGPEATRTPPAEARGKPPESAPSASARTHDSGSQPHEAPSPQRSVSVEPGDRLPVAGDKVDQVLAGSSLQVSAAHDRLSEQVEAEAPMFAHLDEWTLAPAGSRLVEQREETPIATPDISHLSLAEDDAHRQS